MATPQATALPFDSLMKFITFGIDAGNLISLASGTQSLNLAEIEALFGLIGEGKDALSHLGDMKAAIQQLTEQQRTDLYAMVMTKLHLPNAKAEEQVEKAMLTICKIHEIYLLWK